MSPSLLIWNVQMKGHVDIVVWANRRDTLVECVLEYMTAPWWWKDVLALTTEVDICTDIDTVWRGTLAERQCSVGICRCGK